MIFLYNNDVCNNNIMIKRFLFCFILYGPRASACRIATEDRITGYLRIFVTLFSDFLYKKWIFRIGSQESGYEIQIIAKISSNNFECTLGTIVLMFIFFSLFSFNTALFRCKDVYPPPLRLLFVATNSVMEFLFY